MRKISRSLIEERTKEQAIWKELVHRLEDEKLQSQLYFLYKGPNSEVEPHLGIVRGQMEAVFAKIYEEAYSYDHWITQKFARSARELFEKYLTKERWDTLIKMLRGDSFPKEFYMSNGTNGVSDGINDRGISYNKAKQLVEYLESATKGEKRQEFFFTYLKLIRWYDDQD